MPISKINAARYPKNWKEISHRIRFVRAEGRCECQGECGDDHGGRCEARHGHRHPVTGSLVTLTTAHLGLPAHLPMLLHVTRYAEAGEIFEAICLPMTLDAELPEWRSMMYNRALTELLRGSLAGDASFIVPLPRIYPGLVPSWPIIAHAHSAAPIWVRLTGASILDCENRQATCVATEPAPCPKVVSTDLELLSAAFTNSSPKSSLGFADQGVSASARARLLVVGGLLGGHGEGRVADCAHPVRIALTGRATDPWALFANVDRAGKFLSAFNRARFSADAVGRDGEGSLTHNADIASSGFSWAGHTIAYHISEYPENCDDDNLKAMCQKCHLKYDRHHHAANAKRTNDAKRQAVLDKAGQLAFAVECGLL